MTIAILILAAIIIVALRNQLIILPGALWRFVAAVLDTMYPWRAMRKEPIVVELMTGVSVQGVCHQRTRDMLYLASVIVYDAEGKGTASDGLYEIPRKHVSYIIGQF